MGKEAADLAWDGAGILEDRFDDLLRRTVGRWQICPLWALRGRMFGLAEKAVIIALLDLWHTTGRPAWFYAPNREVVRLAGISTQAFHTARASLIRKCVILTKPGKRGRPKDSNNLSATSYSISQDFLQTLAKDTPPPLNTSTYSVGQLLDIYPGRSALNNV